MDTGARIPSAAGRTCRELPLSELSPVVEKWLVAQSLTLQGLSYQSGTLVVSTAGPHPPKSSEDLTALITARFNYPMPVSLAWTHTPGAIGSNDTETASAPRVRPPPHGRRPDRTPRS